MPVAFAAPTPDDEAVDETVARPVAFAAPMPLELPTPELTPGPTGDSSGSGGLGSFSVSVGAHCSWAHRKNLVAPAMKLPAMTHHPKAVRAEFCVALTVASSMRPASAVSTRSTTNRAAANAAANASGESSRSACASAGETIETAFKAMSVNGSISLPPW